MANESISNATCHRYVDDHPDLTNEPYIMVIFAALYVHIFVLGIAGNVAVLYLTLKNRHLQSVQNIFILNLAASDVLMCLISLPITPITNVYKTWFFASPVCKLIPLVQGASVLVSTFSLSAIALDRYNLVVRPHRHPLRSRGASVVALLLWIVSVLVCMPYGWYMDVVQIGGLCGEFCTENWPSPEVRKCYALMVLVMQFILPFATMAVCYYTIFARLRERTVSKLKRLSERTQLLECSVGNSVMNVTAIQYGTQIYHPARRLQRRPFQVLLFGLMWLPHNVYSLIIEYDEGFFNNGERDNTYIVSMIAHLISMTTNVANPILYAWLNPSFKEMLLTSIRGRPLTQGKPITKTTSVRV
uniref:G_PROTEIN_RECEP_F1_2 domain-containing protein n=1 Tax=Angiostrongylus cantonensis TaxID=6313 RepID=A0A0K0CSW9_ANGCA